jgi:predicted nucleic acid-binding protein
MRLVVADTGPLNYLVLLGEAELLPRLFEKIFVPNAVRDELANPRAPETVRRWIAEPPPWLEIHPDPARDTAAGSTALDRGERAAIALALSLKVEAILMDDSDGVAVAYSNGLTVMGTLGVLDLAARRGLIDLAEAFERLKATNFYYRQGLLDALLAKHKKGEKS